MNLSKKEFGIGRLSITPLKRLSPTRYIALKECILREVLSASGNATLLPESSYAILGRIVHKLLQTVSRSKFDGNGIAEIENIWNKYIFEAEAQLSLSPLSRHLVPLKQSVPDFQVRKLRAYRMACEIAKSVEQNNCSGVGRGPHKIGSELWVESEDGLIGGYIDRASLASCGYVLSDYKTGNVYNHKVGKNQRDLKKPYRTQMEIYAALFWINTRIWPIRLEVIPLQGEALEVEYETEHALLQLNEARLYLEFVNSQVESVRNGSSEVESLASPKPAHCKFCLFRPVCEAYWNTRMQRPNSKWPIDIKGIIVDLMHYEKGQVCLIIKSSTNQSSTTIRNISDDVDRHPLLQFINKGSYVEIYELKHEYHSGYCTESNRTVIYNN